jgi:hypothetical protein
MRRFPDGSRRARGHVSRRWQRSLSRGLVPQDGPLPPARRSSRARPARQGTSMRRYSVFALVREGLRQHSGWDRAWASPAPKSRYDVVVVGAGGPRPRDGLLPRQEPRHHQCRGDREGVARRRQHGPQHHDHPLELPPGRLRRDLREEPRALRDAEPGPQLQRHVLAPRRDDARPDPARGPRLQAHRRGQRAPGRGHRVHLAPAGQGALPHHPHRGAALPGPGRPLAAPRRHRAHDAWPGATPAPAPTWAWTSSSNAR